MLAQGSLRTTRALSRVSEIHASLSAMHVLAARVLEFQADVVVLVARKMPHLAEALSLDFGKGALLMSDIAIPYAHRALQGMRIAVVDDVVNVGSTIDRARSAAQSCGASCVEMFSLGRKVSGKAPAGIHYVYDTPMSERDYQIHVAAVPKAIRSLAKPYDLTFPLIPCRFIPPIQNGSELLRRLALLYGWETVRDISPDRTENSQVRQLRYTLDCPNQSGNFKIRFYIDVTTGTCNVVPMAIPAALSADNLTISSPYAKRVLEVFKDAATGAPSETLLWPGEAYIRAALFARSLELGVSCLREWGDLLSISSPEIFSRDAAACVFGPSVYSIDGEVELPTTVEKNGHAAMHAGSGFLDHFPCDQLIAAARSRLPETYTTEDRRSMLDCFIAFDALFSEIAQLVGANDPTRYESEWPYTKNEVRDKPYLRLRVGPTFGDVVELLALTLWGKVPNNRRFRHIVSELLDRAIDAGAVVPTFAHADGVFYRVYRRGENDEIDSAVRRVQYAIYSYGRSMSVTRVSKIDAILAFSRAYCGKTIARPLDRGTVGTLPATILDDPNIPVASFARNTGRLRTVKGDE